ncbi:hypothetical protein HDU86_006304, partial [Geranomyces michiganensis]
MVHVSQFLLLTNIAVKVQASDAFLESPVTARVFKDVPDLRISVVGHGSADTDSSGKKRPTLSIAQFIFAYIDDFRCFQDSDQHSGGGLGSEVGLRNLLGVTIWAPFYETASGSGTGDNIQLWADTVANKSDGLITTFNDAASQKDPLLQELVAGPNMKLLVYNSGLNYSSILKPFTYVGWADWQAGFLVGQELANRGSQGQRREQLLRETPIEKKRKENNLEQEDVAVSVEETPILITLPVWEQPWGKNTPQVRGSRREDTLWVSLPDVAKLLQKDGMRKLVSNNNSLAQAFTCLHRGQEREILFVNILGLFRVTGAEGSEEAKAIYDWATGLCAPNAQTVTAVNRSLTLVTTPISGIYFLVLGTLGAFPEGMGVTNNDPDGWLV